MYGGLVALLGVAVTTLAATRWFPQLDLAMTELRVRDVASLHPPLVGLIGRIGFKGQVGSHLGPVSFYALWPFYQLFGASAWALEAAAACLHAVAIGTAIWIAFRRVGLALVTGVVGVVLGLMVCLGPSQLTQPWNPYLPIFWWLALVLATWSVVGGDIVLLPVAAVTGTFCAQTHVSYVVPVGALFALMAIHVIARVRRAEPADRLQTRRWGLATAGVLFVLWLPPVLQQVTSAHGNLSIAINYFANASTPAIGLRRGVELMLAHLNPWALLTPNNSLSTGGTLLPGAVLIVLWGASGVLAWRLRERALAQFHAVLAVALAAGVFSMSRIFGYLWGYLVLWAWCLCGLVIVAILWTLSVAIGRVSNAASIRVAQRVAAVLVAIAFVSMAASFVREARRVEAPPDASQNAVARGLALATLSNIERGAAPGGGRRGDYLVTYTDPILLGSQAYVLVDELDRAGIRVGMVRKYAVPVGTQRVLDPDRASAVVHLAVGPDIGLWEKKPGVVEVANIDTRTPLQRYGYDLLRQRAIAQLTAAGLQRLVPQIDENVFLLMTNDLLPGSIHVTLAEMIHVGEPVAVFIGPPEYARST